jgi:hypothetical protein
VGQLSTAHCGWFKAIRVVRGSGLLSMLWRLFASTPFQRGWIKRADQRAVQAPATTDSNCSSKVKRRKSVSMERFYFYKILLDGTESMLGSSQTLDNLGPKINAFRDGSDGARYFVHDLMLGVTIACEQARPKSKTLDKPKFPPGSKQA